MFFKVKDRGQTAIFEIKSPIIQTFEDNIGAWISITDNDSYLEISITYDSLEEATRVVDNIYKAMDLDHQFFIVDYTAPYRERLSFKFYYQRESSNSDNESKYIVGDRKFLF